MIHTYVVTQISYSRAKIAFKCILFGFSETGFHAGQAVKLTVAEEDL